MDRISKRGLLKKGILATSGMVLTGKVSASQASNQGLRLRRGLDDPITTGEIKSKKRRILKEVPEARSGDKAPQRSESDLEDDEYIVGYNLDVIDGVPREWVGVYKDSEIENNTLNVDVEVNRSSQAIAKIHQKANEAAVNQGRK